MATVLAARLEEPKFMEAVNGLLFEEKNFETFFKILKENILKILLRILINLSFF